LTTMHHLGVPPCLHDINGYSNRDAKSNNGLFSAVYETVPLTSNIRGYLVEWNYETPLYRPSGKGGIKG